MGSGADLDGFSLAELSLGTPEGVVSPMSSLHQNKMNTIY